MNRPTRSSERTIAHDPKTLRVVLVEDSDDSREMLGQLLASDGHQVQVASNGLEGLDTIVNTEPDVALLDIGLPDLDGYQVARAVRERFAKDKIHLIALTGYGTDEDHEAVLEAGFDQHLVKPVRMKDLRTALGNTVSANRG